jgi:hypothetical protein
VEAGATLLFQKSLNTNTMTMTIKTKVTQNVEQEIELPYFFIHASSYYKVDTDRSFCSVTNLGTFRNISFSEKITSGFEMEYVIKGTPCTEDEFNAAFDKAFNSIANTQKSCLV